MQTTEQQSAIWLSKDGAQAHFVIDLGCQQSFQQILLRNCHNAGARDRSTHQFRYRLRLKGKGSIYFINSPPFLEDTTSPDFGREESNEATSNLLYLFFCLQCLSVG